MKEQDVEISKRILELKDLFMNKRHGERLQLINLRFDLGVKFLNLKDGVAIKRFKEKLLIMNKRMRQ